MINIDLCKLRTGDIVFSLYPSLSSWIIAAGTGSLVSHAAIVIYPDVWFETNGLGSGFRLLKEANCYQHPSGGRSAIVELGYSKIFVLRLNRQWDDTELLKEISRNIILKYPKKIEFLPLMFPFKFAPRTSEKIIRKIIGLQASGGYCSAMVYKILNNIYQTNVPYQEHISPGTLKRMLLQQGAKKIYVQVGDQFDNIPPDNDLNLSYDQIVKVVKKLESYQYHHDRISFETALSATFSEMGLSFNSQNYNIEVNILRSIITDPKHFLLHKKFWNRWYS